MMQERKIRLAIFVVIGLLVGGIILDALSRFTVVNSAIATLVRPINFIVGGAASGARSVSDFFTSKGTLQKENAALKTENDDLRQNNVELIAMKAENERLSKLLKFKELHPKYELMPAKVISRDMGDFKDVILIDKGSDEGLRLNMRGDSRAAGIVNGVAGPDLSLEMRNLARNADVLPGDTIVSSGYTGYHPEGLVIGTVEDVQMDPGGLTKTASIIPSVDYTHLEEALVITNYAGFADFLREEGKDPNKNIKGGAGR